MANKPPASDAMLRDEWVLHHGAIVRDRESGSWKYALGCNPAWSSVYRMGRLNAGLSPNDPPPALLLAVEGRYDTEPALTDVIRKVYDFGRGIPWPGLSHETHTYSEVSVTIPNEGRKDDKDKPDLRQLRNLPNALAAVCRVLDYGAKKYGPANFAKVASERYDTAMIRHVLSEGRDVDTGELHAAHVACCALIYLENRVTGKAEHAKEEDDRE